MLQQSVEANDIIYMGSNRRSVMAQFVITASKTEEVPQKTHIEKSETPTAESTKSPRRWKNEIW